MELRFSFARVRFISYTVVLLCYTFLQFWFYTSSPAAALVAADVTFFSLARGDLSAAMLVGI